MLWIEDPIDVFLNPRTLTSFLPVFGIDGRTADRDEQLNSIMRFAVYFAIAMVLVGRANVAIFSLIIGAALTYYMNTSADDDYSRAKKEGFDEGNACRQPSDENPFMNPMPYDDPEIPGACDVDDPLIARRMDDAFNKNLYRDVSDIFSNQASDRQYYSMPVTTVPNMQVEFAKWLYDTGPTCKEDQSRCSIKKYQETPDADPKITRVYK